MEEKSRVAVFFLVTRVDKKLKCESIKSTFRYSYWDKYIFYFEQDFENYNEKEPYNLGLVSKK